MNDIELMLAFIGAYALGIFSAPLALLYFVKKWKREEEAEKVAMDEAVGVVQDIMPGSTILTTEKA